MNVTIATTGDKRPNADMLVLPYFSQDQRAVLASKSLRKIADDAESAIEIGDFSGKEEEAWMLYPHAAKKEKRLLLVGLGPVDCCQSEMLRRAGAAIGRIAKKKKIAALNVLVPDGLNGDPGIDLLEGILLSNYAFDKLLSASLKEAPRVALTAICLIGPPSALSKKCQRTLSLIEAVRYTRDLVNGNADDVHAESLAEEARGLATTYSALKTTVLRRKQIEEEKMGLLLAVNRAAPREPTLITVEYRGNPSSSDLTMIVGKGITFDTGGLNIKPTGAMETMRCDMAGAAAVLGTMQAIAALKLKVNVVGVVAAAENCIGPMSYKPGDVYRARNGTTVEISNTDAEGRLILADALSYGQDRFSPSRIIDLATLTGAMVIALGEEITGYFCNDDDLAQSLSQAGETSGDRLWRMPLVKEYRELLKSTVADIKNSAGKPGGSITAALFLYEFIQSAKKQHKTPWAHLDIAGTAFLSEPKRCHPTSATGVGVRLLVRFFEMLSHR